MKLRGRVMKLERVRHEVQAQSGTREDSVLWTRRFRAADPAYEQVYQDILAYGRANRAEYVYAERKDEIHASECFKAIFFPIRHVLYRDSDPRCAEFHQTPDMLRRLVNGLWNFQRISGERFPLDYHWVDFLFGPDGEGMRKLWCLYANLADLWVADREHPTVLAWRRRFVEEGLDR